MSRSRYRPKHRWSKAWREWDHRWRLYRDDVRTGRVRGYIPKKKRKIPRRGLLWALIDMAAPAPPSSVFLVEGVGQVWKFKDIRQAAMSANFGVPGVLSGGTPKDDGGDCPILPKKKKRR